MVNIELVIAQQEALLKIVKFDVGGYYENLPRHLNFRLD
jgi:hypothetical protein